MDAFPNRLDGSNRPSHLPDDLNGFFNRRSRALSFFAGQYRPHIATSGDNIGRARKKIEEESGSYPISLRTCLYPTSLLNIL